MSHRFRVVMALIFGGALSVLSAWLTAWHKCTLSKVHQLKSSQWPVTVPADWPSEVSYAVTVGTAKRIRNWSGSVGAKMVTTGPGSYAKTVIVYHYASRETGWPVPCMQRLKASKGLELWPWERGIPVPTTLQRTDWEDWTHRLPLIPLPLGYTINTVFYGAVSWFALAGFGRCIQSNRRRRRRCVDCAYPVAGLTICPECGRPVATVKVNLSAPAATILP